MKIKIKKKNKDLKNLYKEEKTAEKLYKKQNAQYRSTLLEFKKSNQNNKESTEIYVDPYSMPASFDTFDMPASYDYKTNTNPALDLDKQTLVLSVSNKQVRQIKRKNNHKRKDDKNKNLTNKDNNVIDIINLSKSYISGKNKVSVILQDVNLSIQKGDFVVLFGKSGSGKSTLLNIISGLDRPTNGQVIVKNHNLPYLSDSQLTTLRRQYIAFIFQQYHLLNNISAYENVETGAILNSDKDQKIDIPALFKEFELEEVMNKYPSQLSGGQQQRISIMRALAKDAEIIFADEPTGALDKKTSDIVMNLLKKINIEQGKTIIMVSHDPDVAKYAKRKIYLNKGKIISDERMEVI